MIHILLLCLLC